MAKIRIAIAGVGNCASSLIQGIHYYADRDPDSAVGLMHGTIGGHGPSDVEVVAAFDIDRRKVGRDVSDAIFAEPNCTKAFHTDVPKSGVPVRMGCILDGVSERASPSRILRTRRGFRSTPSAAASWPSSGAKAVSSTGPPRT